MPAFVTRRLGTQWSTARSFTSHSLGIVSSILGRVAVGAAIHREHRKRRTHAVSGRLSDQKVNDANLIVIPDAPTATSTLSPRFNLPSSNATLMPSGIVDETVLPYRACVAK